MILLKPTVIINRLVVEKDGRVVMEIPFHEGLNVIVGENSSGKTTAVRFVAYALGAEGVEFNRFALLCSYTYLEISANDARVTLRRHVSSQQMQPLSIFWGDIKTAREATPSMWQQFPYKISESKESFSQVMFRLLGLPELRGEAGSNITMHQLLRLIYSDQESSSSDLFRYDRFDRGITRAAVGDYLLGVDSTELYDLRLAEAAADKHASEIRSNIKTIYRTFGASGTNVSLEFIENSLRVLGSEIIALQQKLEDVGSSVSSKISSSKEDNELRDKLNAAHAAFSMLKKQKIDLEAEISDSELFLRELEERLFSLEESTVAESYLGTAVFSFCPSCFTKLDSVANKAACSLCKSSIAEDSARSQLARMRNELALQLKESEKIRVQQLDELDGVKSKIPTADVELKLLEAEFKRNQNSWRSPEQILLQKMSRELGNKEQEIKNLLELKKLADLLDKFNQQLGDVEGRLEWVRGRIEAVAAEQKNLRNLAYLSVANNLRMILKDDIIRGSDFANANVIDIDFAANQLTIDGQRQFSASSMVLLHHGFHVALLLSSLDNSFFRYPRFLILDGVEDGGMEVGRSYNFQKNIAKYSVNATVRHQIIMTTMSVCPDLDSEKYVVGRKFTHDHKSIDVI